MFLLSPVFCEGIKTQNEFDKMSYTCTIAYLEKFFLLHVLQKSLIKHLSFLKKRKKIVNPTPYLLQNVDKFTHGKSSLKKNLKNFFFEYISINV